MRIAFLGIGIMGTPMACHLQAAGNEVRVWNRTPAKAQAIADKVGSVAATAAEAAFGCEAAIVMVSDDAACDAVLFDTQAYAELAKGALVIVMSTISVAAARRQAQLCTEAGLGYVDAPVSGGEKGAQQASLSVMVGGSEKDFSVANSLLEKLGRPVHVGPVGSGQLAKAVNQAIVANTIISVAEGLLLAKAGGADPARVREALLGGFADSTILKQHGKRMIVGDFKPGGPSVHQLKDLHIINDLANELGTYQPLTSKSLQLYKDFVENYEGGDLDHSAIYSYLQKVADKQ